MAEAKLTFPRWVYHPAKSPRICPDPEQHEAALASGWSDTPIAKPAAPGPAQQKPIQKLLEEAYVERDQLRKQLNDLTAERDKYQAAVADLSQRLSELEAAAKKSAKGKKDADPAAA